MSTKLPHPPRRFFTGNLHQIAGENTIEKMIKLATEYGSIFEVKILNIKLIFVTDLELAKELLNDEKFPKVIDGPIKELRRIAGDGLFTAYTEEANWKKAHHVLTPGFAQRSIRGYVPAMAKICDKLLEKWEKIPANQYFNLSKDMTRLTFETIGICGFDYSFDCFKTEKQHDFIEAMLFTLDESVQRARTPSFLQPFRFKKNKKDKQYLTYVNNLMDGIIAKRKQNPKEYASKFDLLSLMLNARDKETNSKLSDENIRYQIFTFMVAGHETTSGLLSFAFYNLISNPDWLARVYEEVDAILGADLDKKISHRESTRFKLIKRVLLESLRLHPPVPVLSVAPKEATTIGKEKYSVEAGQSCMVWTYHIQRDPKIWGKNAEQFNPDNFLPENIAKRDRDAFKAFGNGKRACIGQQFAMTEATLAIAKILQRYKLTLDPDYKFGLSNTITLRPLDLMVKLEKRSNSDRYHIEPLLMKREVIAKNPHIIAHNTPFLILYGSNMGSAEELAVKIEQDAQRHGFRTTLASLDDYTQKLPKEGLIQIISSTYNGLPPDNAKKFESWLSQTQEDLAGLQFSVFGCGNTQWNTYQLFPNFIDRTLKRLGANRFYQKGSADASADFDADFKTWYRHYWVQIIKQLGIGKSNTKGLQFIKKLANYTPLKSGQYNNDAALITAVCQRYNLAAEEFIKINDQEPILIQELLKYKANLKEIVSMKQLETLVKATECPPEKIKLQQYFNAYETEIVANKKTVLDLLQEFEACEISFQDFLTLVK